MVVVSGWCLSSQRFTILRLRVLERNRKSTASPSKGTNPIAVSKATFPVMRARWKRDMPRFFASQISHAPIARSEERRVGKECRTRGAAEQEQRQKREGDDGGET